MGRSAFCATCASLLPNELNVKTEKPLQHRTLTCCGRTICAGCLESKRSFIEYCPYCSPIRLPRMQGHNYPTNCPESLQPSSGPAADGSLPTAAPPYTASTTDASQAALPGSTSGMALEIPRDSSAAESSAAEGSATRPSPSDGPQAPTEAPPPYSQHAPPAALSAPATQAPEGRNIHYLRPQDTLPTLALAYGTTASRLLVHNGLSDAALLHSRVSLEIPPECRRRSISSTLPGDAETRERNAKLLRLMQAHKVRREVAEVYLDQAGGDLARAMETWEADSRWEQAHPLTRRGGTLQGAVRVGELSPLRVAELLK